MAFNVSSLTAYVDQTGDIIAKSVFGAKTAKLIRQMPNVKGSKSINIYDQPITFQADACGFTSIDTTTFTQRTLVVGAVKHDQSWCNHDLDGYYTQFLNKAGSYQDVNTFEEGLLTYEASVIAATLETAIWNGDINSGSANLSKFDGLLKAISGAVTTAATSVVSGTTTGTTAGLPILLDAIYSKIPATVLDKPDFVVFMGFDTFRLYTTGLKNLNLFHYTADAVNYEITIPGTTIRVIAVHGLDNTGNKIVGARLSNLVYGYDLENDSANAQIWYSQDNQEVRSTVKFKAGANIAFPPEIVYYF